jgi:RND family efflux transporter MFP subunit
MDNLNEKTEAAPPRRSLFRRLWGFLPTFLVIFLVGVIFLLGNQIKTKGDVIKEEKAAGLRTTRAQTNVVSMEMVPSQLRERINLPGAVKPWIALKIVAEVQGKIVAKRVIEGQRVLKDAVLAEIDARDYRNAYDSAQASYSLAAAQQKRLQRLFKDNVSTQAQLDDIIATVKTSKAAMDNAALNLERCKIRAPMDGIVDRLYIDVGQYLQSADPVAEILEIDRVKVVVGIPESDVADVRQLNHFTIRIDALDGQTFEGSYHHLYKTADSFARLYNLEIAVDNADGRLLPDMFARVEIVKKEIPDGLAVPLYALLNINESNAVYVLDQGVARLQPVDVGIQDGWRMEVRNGLKPGDQVVVVGQRSINDGEAVNVTRTIRSIEEL